MVNSVSDSREKILLVARHMVQAHGYSGLNFRDLAQQVGIRAASIYHHFPSKAALAAAVAKRYWQDAAAELESISASADPLSSLRSYPSTFRRALLNNNRMCLSSFMASEYDDLPEQVMKEVHTFADVNVAWLKKNLSFVMHMEPQECEEKARAIFAAIAGAQLIARSRSDVSLYDAIVAAYQDAGLLPK